jgi:ThiF family
VFHELVSHNPDIKRLVDKGYALKFEEGFLIVRDIPYLNEQKELCIGAIVTKIEFVDRVRMTGSGDHQIFFAGSHPHSMNGTAIPDMAGGPTQLALADKSVVVERTFSNKPASGFANLYEKIESYTNIIAGPAMVLHGATPLTFRIDEDTAPSSIFKFRDTLSSRAEIGDLAQKLNDDVVAIIGLGGTGSNVLDFIVKSPVKEVRGFDPDVFHVHNSFRSPGCLDESELGLRKADVYQNRYDNFRFGLTIQNKFIDSSSEAELDGVTFAFVCVDKGSSRSRIFDLLLEKRIPFIDVGMGLNRKAGPLNGMLRVTYYPAETGAEVRAKHLAEMADDPDDAYVTNVQIAELNALNATLAVVRYKQVRGFYADTKDLYHLLFNLDNTRIVGESSK